MKRTLKVNEKLLPFLTAPQPIKVAVGGRGSGKSIGLCDMAVCKMEREEIDVYCLREYQETIAESVHRTLTLSITDRLGLEGWDIQESKIISPFGNRTAYKGAARNPNNIQGAENYLLSMFGEAHAASQESIDKLLPTILRKPGAQCWFDANPQSSEDPFSKRFIVPYMDQLLSTGVYQDDLHYIVMVNWRDNPWWNEEQERLREWDFRNLPRAKYDWIWEGHFNDSVDDALIMSEWFDACVDAHKRLGFKAEGMRIAAHDPSAMGEDTKGYALRHGSVFLDVQEMATGSVNEGCDWATGLAIQSGCDYFTWDCDGMGVALNDQVGRAFQGKKTSVSMYRGSESVDFPDSVYEPTDRVQISDQKKNKDVARNKRCQYYMELRDRVYRTYRAVEFGEYHDPEKLISFSSDIKILNKLRAEVCRMPVKPNGNGLFDLYTKQQMKDKFKFKSPNLADSVVMALRYIAPQVAEVRMPRPIRPKGIRR